MGIISVFIVVIYHHFLSIIVPDWNLIAYYSMVHSFYSLTLPNPLILRLSLFITPSLSTSSLLNRGRKERASNILNGG